LITNNIPENQGAAAAQRKGVERNKWKLKDPGFASPYIDRAIAKK
jgi:hypothetical protein